MTRAFHSIHTHGFVRAAVCTPALTPGDPGFNAAETLRLAQQGDVEACDLMLFPELGLSAYAIDDLFLQDALLARVEDEIRRIVEASVRLKPVLIVGAPLVHNGRLYNCAVAISRGRILGVVPKSFLPNYREYYEKRWFASGIGLEGLKAQLAGQNAAFGPDLVFAADEPVETWKAYLHFHTVDKAAPYLSDALAQENFNFYGKTLRGQEEMQPRWKRVLNTINLTMGEALGQIYVEHAFPPESPARGRADSGSPNTWSNPRLKR